MKKIDARIDRSRRAIIDAALELLPAKPSATLAELAGHANVARATLYRHFKNRTELIRVTARECAYAMNGVLGPISLQPLTGREAIEACIRAYFPIVDKYYFLKFFQFEIEEDEVVRNLIEAYYATLRGIVTRAVEEGSVRNTLQVEFITHALDCVLYAGWEMLGKGMSVDEAADHTISVFFDGAAP